MISQGSRPVDISLAALVLAVLNRWRLVLGVFALIVLAGVALLVTRSRVYIAEASFVPEARSELNLPSALAAIGGQFGLRLGGSSAQSPDFYAALLQSRELGYRLLQTRVRPDSVGVDSLRLVDFFLTQGRASRTQGQSRDSSVELARGVRRLRGTMKVTVDRRTSIIQVRVSMKDPQVAAAVANGAIRSVNEFNLEQRRLQARERRSFTEARVAEASRELAAAERELESFYRRNRVWQDAPSLQFEVGRLERRVEEAQELYLGLKREFESARIQEVNDTPVITVVDSAVVPHRPRRALRPMPLLFLLTFAGIVALVAGFAAEGLHRARAGGSPEVVELERRWRRMRGRSPGERERKEVEVGDD